MNTIPLIPRKVLFGNPDRAGVNISHDGAYLSWLASRDGVMNVWVARRDNLAAAVPVTHDTGRGHPLLLVGLHQPPHSLHPRSQRR